MDRSQRHHCNHVNHPMHVSCHTCVHCTQPHGSSLMIIKKKRREILLPLACYWPNDAAARLLPAAWGHLPCKHDDDEPGWPPAPGFLVNIKHGKLRPHSWERPQHPALKVEALHGLLAQVLDVLHVAWLMLRWCGRPTHGILTTELPMGCLELTGGHWLWAAEWVDGEIRTQAVVLVVHLYSAVGFDGIGDLVIRWPPRPRASLHQTLWGRHQHHRHWHRLTGDWNFFYLINLPKVPAIF